MNPVVRLIVCGLRLKTFNVTLSSGSARMCGSVSGSGSRGNGNITGTSTLLEGSGLVQHGDRVQELPLIVRIVGDTDTDNIKTSSSSSPEAPAPDGAIHKLIKNEFTRCQTKKDVFALLQRCSTISPNIAAGAINRLNRLQNDNTQIDLEIDDIEIKLMDKLVELVREGDVSALIAALSDPPQICTARDRLCDEILLRVSEGRLNVSHLCDVVEFFGKHNDVIKFAESIDKLWIGFTDSETKFTEADLIRCMDILEYLKASQRVVLDVLEKNALKLWWKLKPSQIVDILDILEKKSILSYKIFSVIGRWTNMNLHIISEETLEDIVAGLTKFSYSDNQLEKALERYVKFKGVNINSPSLISTILEHCFLFRIRNVHILGGCCEYFIAHGRTSGSLLLKPLLSTIGWLHYVPNNNLKFWQEVEAIFNEQFHTMNPCDILDVMLSCVYLEKHPMNFVCRIFNPTFLEQVNSSLDVEHLRRKLKLLDLSLSLDCKYYDGPMLPKDHWSKNFWHDGRIRRLVNSIKESFETVAGSSECFSTFVILPNLYTSALYVIDVMMHPKGLKNSILNLRFRSDRNINVAVLIHLPEHYSSNGEFLIGPQLMRIRHFRKLGLKVVSLKYDSLSRLKMHRHELEQYMKTQLKQAQPAFKE